VPSLTIQRSLISHSDETDASPEVPKVIAAGKKKEARDIRRELLCATTGSVYDSPEYSHS
jgi:hypothetical protein